MLGTKNIESYWVINQSSILYNIIAQILDLYFTTFVDKHAHGVWVNGQEVEVEVIIGVEIFTMRSYVIEHTANLSFA